MILKFLNTGQEEVARAYDLTVHARLCRRSEQRPKKIVEQTFFSSSGCSIILVIYVPDLSWCVDAGTQTPETCRVI